MDAEGNVLTSPRARTVPSFGETLSLVENYLAVKEKADAGDETVLSELFVAEFDLGMLGLDEAKQRLGAMKDLSPALTSRIEKKIREMEMRDVLASAGDMFAAGRWAEASALYAKVTEATPDNGMAWFNLGYSLHVQGKLEDALVAHQKAAEIPGVRQTLGMYNAACAHALLGNVDQAFTWLKKAAQAGYKDTAQLDRDSDLDSLRDDPRYAEIIALMKGD